MTTNSRMLFLIGVAFHLLVIAGHNILATADGVRTIYGWRLLPVPTEHRLRALLSHPVAAHYGIFSGIGMGYGFYAPQVGSPYVAMLERKSGGHCDTLFHPGLRTSTGILRFSSALDLFQWLTVAPDTAAHGMAKQLVDELAKQYRRRSGADSVRCHIYRIQPPSFQRPSDGIGLREVFSSSGYSIP
ncbi:hypothetical protein GCM10011386_33230 [Parapedobacter defluvii]|uniref:N-acetyltransferase domain-containing protein n=1 Tax=Parapedobacter defluvii TaxID=2045106 RepID=A0ABQ1MFT3_9SPHI|nr:hypothetical protein [Parapedobacter defluvii]GGC38475.1 hypothetical protein GCM10011386_33230 [Parapedobacter defluvii]